MFRASFFISGKPKPWKRPQNAKWGGRYVDKQTRVYKGTCANYFWRNVPSPLTGAIKLVLEIRVKKPLASKYDQPISRKIGDVDNFAKSILDAGNGIAWLDDSQITDLSVRKVWAFDGIEGVMVEIHQ